jgi:hypothetical protein
VLKRLLRPVRPTVIRRLPTSHLAGAQESIQIQALTVEAPAVRRPDIHILDRAVTDRRQQLRLG